MAKAKSPAKTKAPTNGKVPVSERALFQRINRVLRQQHCVLRYGHHQVSNPWGQQYVVDLVVNKVRGGVPDVERLGRELGVLKPYEKLVERRKPFAWLAEVEKLKPFAWMKED